jgi:hypothetical protein
MERFGWTYQQYEPRPLWFDTIYTVKLKAEAQYQKVLEQRAKDESNGHKQ